MTKIVHDHKFTISYNEEGYYELIVKDNVEIFIDDIHRIIEAQRQICGEKKPILVSGGVYTTSNTETLKYISENKNAPFSKSTAYILSSISQKLIGNFYLKIYKPQRPTRFFNDKEAAINWLKEYI